MRAPWSPGGEQSIIAGDVSHYEKVHVGNPPGDQARFACNQTAVLIVDDNAAYRRALRRVIESAGYVLAGEAETGEEGLEMARSTNPRVIFMDVHMPGINGIVAARRIAADVPGVVVVLMTVTVDEALAAELSGTGLECVRKEKIRPETIPAMIAAARGEASAQ